MGSKLPKLGQASARMSGRRLIVSGNIRKQHTAQQRFIEKGVESVRLDVQFYRGLWKSGSVTGDLAYPNVPSVNDISCMDLPNLTAMEIAVEVVRAMAFGMAMEIKKTSMK
jgi:hypothetical protein